MMLLSSVALAAGLFWGVVLYYVLLEKRRWKGFLQQRAAAANREKSLR